MSELNDTLAAVVADRQSFTAERGQMLTGAHAGEWITAELEEISDLELNTELGRDPREAYTLHIIDRVAAARINATDRIRFTIRNLTLILQVLPGRRQDSVYSPQVRFGCMKITEKDT